MLTGTGAGIAREAQEQVIGKGGARDLRVGPLAFVEVKIVETSALLDRRFGIGSQVPIVLRHLIGGIRISRERCARHRQRT